MSTSTDAILFYGIDLGEDLDIDEIARNCGFDPDDEDYEFDTLDNFYLKKIGIYRGEDENYVEWGKRKELALNGVGDGRHCSGYYPMHYISIGTHYEAYRGHPTEVTNLGINSDWDDKIKKYCETIGIPFSKPKWILASYWG